MKQLNKKEIKTLNELLVKYKLEINEKSRVSEATDLVLVDSVPFLIKINEKYYPTLKSTVVDKLPCVYVDRGAIPFVIKGADLMRPGIISFDDFEKDAVVVIRDSEHKKAFALGIALFSSEELKVQEKGRAIKTYHYVGDSFWNYGK